MVGRAGGIGGFRRPLHRRVVKRSIRRAGTGRAGRIEGQRSSFMRMFLDSHSARLDKKGRASFPASFRAALERFEVHSFYLRPHHLHTCIEGFSNAALDGVNASLGAMDAYSEDQELLALALFGDTAELNYDAEGRFSLPSKLQRHAQIEDTMVFVGMGDKFQIWEPALLDRRKADAILRLRDQRPSLPPGHRA
ncbi:MAG: mraZ [Rhodospirillales bacterium]|jgi:MraZ protein|nr:mraZ [Rhodospirillales bacterium]